MEEVKLRATPAARRLAKRLGVKLPNVTGSGFKGRIHQDDVANFNYQKKVHVSPLARNIAAELGIDLKGIIGSGHNDKIMKEDVVALISDPKVRAQFDQPEPSIADANKLKSQSVTSQKEEKKENASSTQKSSVNEGKSETMPLSMMRKVIAKRMSESYFSIPSFIQNWEIDMTEMKVLREKLIDPIKEKTGKKVTYTDLISIAVVKTLMNHKYINAALSEDASQITFHNYVNLGLAVGMDEGLLVPVVKNAHTLSLSEMVVALKDVTERTLNKKLLPDEQTGSTFTISNLGMYGVDTFTAIINQPNAAILSVASTQEQMVVRNGEAVIRPIMKISLTSDHRIIDGLTAAKFMTDLKHTLENPLSLLI